MGRGRWRFKDVDDETYRLVRRRVRSRLRFLRHAFFFVLLNLAFFLIDLATGGGFWVQWVALIWGIFLAVQFFSAFVAPRLWGPDVERRLIEAELRRREER
jgi:hypothetical protein